MKIIKYENRPIKMGAVNKKDWIKIPTFKRLEV